MRQRLRRINLQLDLLIHSRILSPQQHLDEVVAGRHGRLDIIQMVLETPELSAHAKRGRVRVDGRVEVDVEEPVVGNSDPARVPETVVVGVAVFQDDLVAVGYDDWGVVLVGDFQLQELEITIIVRTEVKKIV